MMSEYRPTICYAFDVNATAVVVVRATRRKRRICHEVIWEGDLDEDHPGCAQAVASALFEARTGKAITTAAMPTGQSIIRWLTTPFPSISKARKVLPTLLDIQLPFPLETCYYQFARLKRDQQQVKALAIVAQRDALQNRINQCITAGFDPMRLDHEALAIWTQSITNDIPLPTTRRIILYLSADHHVLVMGQGTSFESTHAGQTGLNQLTSTGPANALPAFTGRIQRMLRTHIPDMDATAVEWFWAGPGSEHTELCQQLEKELPASITFKRHGQASAFLANGLATRALQPDIELPCDLRTDTLIHPVTRQLNRKKNRRLALHYLAASLVIIGINIGWLQFLSIRTQQAQRQVKQQARAIAPTATIQYGQELLDAQRAYEKNQVELQPFLDVFGPSTSKQLKQILDMADQHAIQIEGLSLRRDYVSLQGSSPEWTDCEYMVQIFTTLGFSVDEPNRRDAGYDEKVHFTIEGTR